jgi:hypothetical protein
MTTDEQNMYADATASLLSKLDSSVDIAEHAGRVMDIARSNCFRYERERNGCYFWVYDRGSAVHDRLDYILTYKSGDSIYTYRVQVKSSDLITEIAEAFRCGVIVVTKALTVEDTGLQIEE